MLSSIWLCRGSGGFAFHLTKSLFADRVDKVGQRLQFLLYWPWECCCQDGVEVFIELLPQATVTYLGPCNSHLSRGISIGSCVAGVVLCVCVWPQVFRSS
ncbi:hypothetical protein DPMN_165445 [Dreissena polymorpha]|uniref:Uncharacterized protein n=1 Tax=Dreissena polymorpha TaxID=45954 RepID=A0A9D4IWE2_DREPO|nr:hypothetical protein DPMN_165445 [Dreissena polymorpha]